MPAGPSALPSSTRAPRRLKLTQRAQHLIALRINDELTQKEIAARIGVSQMQVSRILRRITDELHERIEL